MVLAERLGGLPLACEMAAAYVVSNGTSLLDYLRQFDQRLPELMGSRPPVEYTSVAVSISLSVKSAGQENPQSVNILQALAHFAPDDIPRWMLDGWPDPKSPAVTYNALDCLLKRALLHSDDHNLSFHPLVRDLTLKLDIAPKQSCDQAIRLLSVNLTAFQQYDVENWPRYAALLPHGEALFASLPDPLPAAPTAVEIANQLGAYLMHALGDYSGSVSWFLRAQRICQRIYGTGHPNQLATMNNLATAYLRLGKVEDARAILDEVLSLRRRVLGGGHPDTLTSMNNLAVAMERAGNFPAARDLNEKTLGARQRHFGERHRDTLTSMNNLAMTMEGMGDLAHAHDLQSRTLHLRTEVLGTEDIDTAASHENLAIILSGQGHQQEAQDQFRRALAIREKHLPPEHPDVQRTRQNLANLEAELSRR